MALTRGNDEILMGTRDGMCIRFSEEHIRTCGRVSMGVKRHPRWTRATM